ncbi:kinase [Phytohabitans rumicis]|uniref:Kinase n=1 Tax=Phytohabitans rumicis TaxID=1076125 RepID=A0A6V8LKG5_9ACTN|nr:kinase [Phytohabitans rumicis]GFJ93125.1 hypothetical protein Prum_067670 [Phytohabitans rumicis]
MGKLEQDFLRRIVLRERDKPGGVAPGLIGHTVRFILDQGYHVVLEGILYSRKYGDMIRSLGRSHRGQTTYYYLDVSLEETLRRHQMRPQATEFTMDDMRGWYAPHDVLNVDGEHIIDESSSMERTIEYIAAAAGVPLNRREDDFQPTTR